MKLMSIAGARPNFMKLAAIAHAIEKHNSQFKLSGNLSTSGNRVKHIIVHTGQHYDAKMSKNFFEDLEIPQPDINLNVGSNSHATQTAEIMQRFEPVLLREMPDVLLVVGDVNSTIACCLVAAKIEYPASCPVRKPVLVHVEAGLRSFDRDMPEEINRILTDCISDLLFVSEASGMINLEREGVDADKVHLVGNVMIDTLQRHLAKSENSTIMQQLEINGPYCLATLHRPSNVDSLQSLKPLIETLINVSQQKKLVFPVHPRTKNILKETGLLQDLQKNENIILCAPLGYLDFLNLLKHSELVITDSGGIQEETTVLNIPCVTLRHNTERPVTITEGTNYLVGTDPGKILETVAMIFSGKGKQGSCPVYWDGHAGERIIKIIMDKFSDFSVY